MKYKASFHWTSAILIVALLLAVAPSASAFAQDAQPLPVDNRTLYIPMVANQWEPLDCPAGWGLAHTMVAIETEALAWKTQVPIRYVTLYNPTAGTYIPADSDYCRPVNPDLSLYGSRMEAKWRTGRDNYAAVALIAVAADGPLPAGDLVAAGLLLAAGGSAVLATLYQAGGNVATPTASGWAQADKAPIVRAVENYSNAQVVYFEPPSVLWGRDTVWVMPGKTAADTNLAAIIDTPTEDFRVYVQPKSGAVQADDFGSILVEASNRPNIKGSVPLSDAQRRQVVQKK